MENNGSYGPVDVLEAYSASFNSRLPVFNVNAPGRIDTRMVLNAVCATTRRITEAVNSGEATRLELDPFAILVTHVPIGMRADGEILHDTEVSAQINNVRYGLVLRGVITQPVRKPDTSFSPACQTDLVPIPPHALAPSAEEVQIIQTACFRSDSTERAQRPAQ